MDAPDHQIKHLKVTGKTAFKDETEQLSNLSASGKENRCLFRVELQIEALERVALITQEPETNGHTPKSSEASASGRRSPAPEGHGASERIKASRAALLYSANIWAVGEDTQGAECFTQGYRCISKFWANVLAPHEKASLGLTSTVWN